MTSVQSASLCAHTTPPFFFFIDTSTAEIYTLSLHDALPISQISKRCLLLLFLQPRPQLAHAVAADRSEEHTSELQSRQYLVCRLLLEKKKEDGCSRASGAARPSPVSITCRRWRARASCAPTC